MADRKIARTLDKILRNEGTIRFRDYEAVLVALGFRFVRQSGSHRVYLHPRISRPFPIQPDGADAKRYQVKELRSMIVEHGLSLDDAK